jgi:hypothetical protein
MWKDKCHVLLIPSHAIPIRFLCMLVDTVPQRHGTIRKKIPTSLVLLKYITFMRRVDVADQL